MFDPNKSMVLQLLDKVVEGTPTLSYSYTPLLAEIRQKALAVMEEAESCKLRQVLGTHSILTQKIKLVGEGMEHLGVDMSSTIDNLLLDLDLDISELLVQRCGCKRTS